MLQSKDANQSSDDWTEDDNFHDRPTGNTDTVLQAMDFREYNQILSLAPGENQTPLGLFQDVYSEYLAFPTIYCGQVRPDNSLRLFQYIIAIFVNGNYEMLIEGLQCLEQIFSIN